MAADETMPTGEELAEKLGAERAGNGWLASCPAHDDGTPSLTIYTKRDGTAGFDCKAGCAFRDVAAALRKAGHLPERKRRTDPDSLEWVSPVPGDAPVLDTTHRAHGPATRVWTYTAPDGAPSFYVTRHEPGGGRKQFHQRTLWRDPAKGLTWSWKWPPRPLPPYNLHQLAADPEARVLVCEGEKAADAAASALPEWVCTTAMGGAKNVGLTDWSHLKGRLVVVWPDADEPGLQAANRIAGLALQAGAGEVRVVAPPDDVASGWDAADAVAAGWDERAVEALVAGAPTWQPPKETAGRSEPPPGLGDDVLAEQFSLRWGNDLRYVASWGRWYIWNGVQWERDDTLLVRDHARGFLRELAGEMGLEPKGASRLTAVKTAQSVLAYAQADRRHAARTDQWDADPWVLNTPAGVVDLRSGAMREHRRADYMTRCTTVSPGNGCEAWLRFLWQITSGDAELTAYLQRLAGYTLTGLTVEHVLVFCYGTGANGKSTFLNTLAGVLGPYAATAAMDAFTDSAGDRHPTDLAGLQGARLVTATETEQGRRWAESRVKAITGGDPIAARYVRQDYFTFTPVFKLVIAGNHKPALRNVDEAFRRRLHLVPFTNTIPPEQRDPYLADKLSQEGPGILSWAIEGCLQWQKQGLAAPERVRTTTDEYFEGEDAVGRWIEEQCILGDRSIKTALSALYTDWSKWAEQHGEYVGTQRRLIKELEDRGFIKGKSSGGTRVLEGIGLRYVDRSERDGRAAASGERTF